MMIVGLVIFRFVRVLRGFFAKAVLFLVCRKGVKGYREN